MVNFRKFVTTSGANIILGRDENSNDKLMEEFKGKDNTILHTSAPGSPFCVIDSPIEPSREDIKISGAVCAAYSQDWRNNKRDIELDVFTGKGVKKNFWMKKGTWKVKKSKKIKIKKADILKFLRRKNETTGTNPNRKKRHK